MQNEINSNGYSSLMTYWLVVYSMESGDFKNAVISTNRTENTETARVEFEKDYPGYKVIHIGKGELPPKTYRSLEYIN